MKDVSLYESNDECTDGNDSESHSNNNQSRIVLAIVNFWESKKVDESSNLCHKFTNTCNLKYLLFVIALLTTLISFGLLVGIIGGSIHLDSVINQAMDKNVDYCHLNSCGSPYIYKCNNTTTTSNFTNLVLDGGCILDKNCSVIVQTCTISFSKSSRIQSMDIEQNYLFKMESLLQGGFDCMNDFGINVTNCCLTPRECGFYIKEETDLTILLSVGISICALLFGCSIWMWLIFVNTKRHYDVYQKVK